MFTSQTDTIITTVIILRERGLHLAKSDYKIAKNHVDAIIHEVETVVVSKTDTIQLTIAALLANGHVLFEDIPGVGKTVLAKALAKTIDFNFSRIQFTPDMMPSDILGISLFNKKTNDFEFRKGPLFSDFILADEINRTTPRTQAALLESMSEKQVTIDGVTYSLGNFFFVLATQNPIEYEGTYPLPEAQLDRFLFQLSIGYPSFKEELGMLDGINPEERLSDIQPVISQRDLYRLKRLASDVYVDPTLIRYALNLVTATRNHPQIQLGISPRGALAFLNAAKSWALTEGRHFVVPDDFINVMIPCFQHRLILQNNFERSEKKIIQLLKDIQKEISVPVKGQS